MDNNNLNTRHNNFTQDTLNLNSCTNNYNTKIFHVIKIIPISLNLTLNNDKNYTKSISKNLPRPSTNNYYSNLCNNLFHPSHSNNTSFCEPSNNLNLNNSLIDTTNPSSKRPRSPSFTYDSNKPIKIRKSSIFRDNQQFIAILVEIPNSFNEAIKDELNNLYNNKIMSFVKSISKGTKVETKIITLSN